MSNNSRMKPFSILAREKCSHCNGWGRIPNPIMQQYRKSNISSLSQYLKKSGLEIEYQTIPEKLTCTRCEGRGYFDRVLSLDEIYELIRDHMVYHDERIASRIKMIAELVVSSDLFIKQLKEERFNHNGNDHDDES